MLEHAQITAAYGRRYTVRTDAGTSYEASTRSKRTDFACGDFVEIRILNGEQAVIENLLPRQSLLYRQDAWKSKLIAANATQLFIVTAAVPSPSEALLQRALIAAEAAAIRPVILLNKTDLPETAALAGVSGSLKDMMRGETNILLGQSGMGKSTLTNALLGEEAARTQSHSAALDSGRHTTTHTRLYHLDGGGKLIDSPGLQEFGLHHLDASELLGCFPDLRHLAGQCRFHNCTHRAEPGCAVKAAADAGEIRPARLEFLQRLTDERLRR